MAATHEGDAATGKHSTLKTVAIFIVVIAVVLVGAYYLAAALVPSPKIGVIDVTGPIGGAFATAMAQEIDYAINSDDIKGVVLIINSPGGAAYAGHDIYYQLRKLRETKPIIASMEGLAASAAFQIGVAANEIYAKPASLVGNVGVIVGQPSPETLSERFITTGPFKATGFSETGMIQKLDLLHADFRDSVIAERSAAPNSLKITGDQLATGEMWIGIEAKEYGLIDELGSTLDAVNRAAELAGLNNYEVVDVRDEYLKSLEGFDLEMAQQLYAEADSQPDFNLTSSEQVEYPSFYQLYIPLE